MSIVGIDIDKNSLVKAMSIRERYEILKKRKQNENDDTLLKQWRERKTILSQSDFDDMLICNDYENKYFSMAINYNNSSDIFQEEIQSASWVKTLRQIFETSSSIDQYEEEKCYQYMFRHLLQYGTQKVENMIGNSTYFDVNVVHSLIKGLEITLLNISQKTIVYEINLFRSKNLLSGENPKERFHSFFKFMLVDDNLKAFYSKYPVLIRLLTTATENYIKNFYLLLETYRNNREYIHSELEIDLKDVVTKIDAGQGDTHEGGKTVIKISFYSGKKILFKPKNLEVVDAYNNFISWINSCFIDQQIKIYKSVTFRHCTFEEEVVPLSCETENEVKSYFKNFGKLAAVLYFLRGNDFHMENIIACRNYPVVVDLETLLQQRNSYKLKDGNFFLKSQMKITEDSISRTALFPSGGLKANLDLSGLSGNEKPLEFEAEMITDDETDSVKYEMRKGVLAKAQNIPTINGVDIGHKEYVDDIVEGFKELFNFFIENKLILKKKIALFSGKKTRVLIRNTMNYSEMLDYSYHPEVMKTTENREKLFENMWKFSIIEKRVIKNEVFDLLHNDIPIFYTYTDSKKLLSSSGEVIDNYFEKSNLELLEESIDQLTIENCMKQASAIKLLTKSYNTLSLSNENDVIVSNIKEKEKNSANYLEAAKNIADRIITSSIIDEKEKLVLLECIVPKEDHWIVGCSDNSFYNGLSGVLLFFYYICKLTNEQRYADFYSYLQNTVLNFPIPQKRISTITGDYSYLTALSYIYEDMETVQIEDIIFNGFKEIEPKIDEIVDIDWLGGSTSILKLSIKMYKLTRKKYYRDISIEIAKKTIELVNERKNIPIGFSHGLSSLVVTFADMFEMTGNLEYQLIFEKLLADERKLIDSDSLLNNSWCHGRVGIGLSRLSIKMNDEKEMLNMKSEIFRYENKIFNSFLSKDDTLCHGNSGVIDFYLELYNNYGGDEYYDISDKIASYILENHDYLVDSSYSLKGLPSVGLYSGSAGIGYMFLRLCSPRVVPSVLA